MGIVLDWSTTYPGAVDDTITSFELLTDTVHDVVVSHPNELAAAVIFLERENTGYKDNNIVTAAANEYEDQQDVTRVIGGAQFNGAQLAHMIPHIRMMANYNLNGGAAQGDLVVSMYDMGAPGTPLLPPELRSSILINNSDDGVVKTVQQVLTPTASPGIGSNQIHTAKRVYEFRVSITGGPAASTANVHWAGLALGVTQ